MKCPTCNILLVSAERDAVEIDYCPSCWGIWLDRGELNLILERATHILRPDSAAPGRPDLEAAGQVAPASSPVMH